MKSSNVYEIPDNYEEALRKLLYITRKVPGDVIELGVHQGRNSIIFGEELFRLKLSKTYYGFDSFNGYSELDLKESPHLKSIQRSGRWNWSKHHVLEELQARFLHNCIIIEGDIHDSVPSFAKSCGPISLLYVDCNAYAAAITAMRALRNKFSVGAIIAIDEHKTGGETRALLEFAAEINGRVITTKNKNGPSAYVVYNE